MKRSISVIFIRIYQKKGEKRHIKPTKNIGI